MFFFSFFFSSLSSHTVFFSLQMKLWNKYKVTSIPSLVFVDAATGKVVCRNGLLVVRDDPKGEITVGVSSSTSPTSTVCEEKQFFHFIPT